MKILTSKQIKDFSHKHDIPDWRLMKAIFELGTNDSNILDMYFEQHTLNNRLDELILRVEEVSTYLKEIKPDWGRINTRIAHLKTDIKNMREEYDYVRPNNIGAVKDYIRRKSELLISGDIPPADFLVAIEVLLSETLK